jgi:Protein of unknown function (DUF1524)/Protein of unknown function DUF262
LEHYKIVSRSKDRTQLLDIISGRYPSEENSISSAYIFFKRKIEKHITHRNDSEQALRKLLNITTKQLSLVMITLDSGENPFVIFETLNFRGLPLEESDLIRNLVFMKLPLDSQDRFDSSLWTPFEALFAKDDQSEAISITDFYRDYLMASGSYVKKNEIYIKFREYYEKNNENPESLINSLKYFAIFYVNIHRPHFIPDSQIASEIQRLNNLDISTSYPLLLYLFDKTNQGSLSNERFAFLLRSLQSFLIRRSVCGESSRAYSHWFPSAIESIKDSENIDDGLLFFLHRKGFPSDADFKKALAAFEIYRREPIMCRLILEDLEKSYGHKETIDLTTSNIQIEHLMPQTLSIEWKTSLGEKWESDYSLLNTIGNLTLSGYNQELYNSIYSEKRRRLSESNFELNKYIIKSSFWNGTSIIERSGTLADEIIEIWVHSKPSSGLKINDESLLPKEGILSTPGRKEYESWNQKLARINPNLRETVLELDSRILSIGRVSTITRTRKAYYKGKHSLPSCFLILEITGNSIIARMEANKSTFKDPLNWSEGGVHSIMFFNSGSKIKIKNKDQLDYAISLMKQAYDLVKSKD